MPRYFFHVHCNGGGSSVDAEGIELADENAAWEEAISTCGQMIHDVDGAMRPGMVLQMEVTDDAGNSIFRLLFRAEAGTAPCRGSR